jgi:hypothetical protein
VVSSRISVFCYVIQYVINYHHILIYQVMHYLPLDGLQIENVCNDALCSRLAQSRSPISRAGASHDISQSGVS